ncbi:hypothetical protein R5R35_002023 [Gryllus longicercus]|uniref:Cytochrome P450 n=1 Tax=Gryllus longicercus TaxID=2509291 RepID=A0AAN9YV50_9ORTH
MGSGSGSGSGSSAAAALPGEGDEGGALPLPLLLALVLVLPAAAAWLAEWRRRRRRFVRLGDRLPGPRGLPLLGNALSFLGANEDVFQTVYRMCFEDSAVVRLWIGPRLLVFLVDPRDVELVLGSNEHLDKSAEYRFFEPWLGDGLLISSGSKWRAHRRLIAPAFHQHVLKGFVPLFAAHGRALVERLRAHAAAGGGAPFDVHGPLGAATVDILLETAMGVTKETDGVNGCEYAAAVIKLCDILHMRHTRLWLRPDWLFRLSSLGREQARLLRVVHGLTEQVIRRKKEEMQLANWREFLPEQVARVEYIGWQQNHAEQVQTPKDDLDEQDENDVGEKRRLAFLDMLLESTDDGQALTDDEIKEEVDTIMFEGHDTTAAASSFFLSLMGIHQDIQERAVQELRSIFGCSSRPATFDDVQQMKFLERCILETLRMYPPVPVVARQLKRDLQLASSDLVVPAGCTVVVGTYRVHRREDLYPHADAFDPDRFLADAEAAQRRHYYSFLAFSAGPRSCVGRKYAMLKLKILLSTILRNFKIYSDIEEKDFRLTGDIILKRAEGFQIRLEQRQEKNLTPAA